MYDEFGIIVCEMHNFSHLNFIELIAGKFDVSHVNLTLSFLYLMIWEIVELNALQLKQWCFNLIYDHI